MWLKVEYGMDMILCGIAWCGGIQFGILPYGMMWFGIVLVLCCDALPSALARCV